MQEQIQIGPYTYEPEAGELCTNGHRFRLEPRSAQVLDVLLAHRGRVVTRERLFDAVWAHRPVVDAALTRCISQIRRALDDRRPHTYLETLPKRGYRLLATAEPV